MPFGPCSGITVLLKHGRLFESLGSVVDVWMRMMAFGKTLTGAQGLVVLVGLGYRHGISALGKFTHAQNDIDTRYVTLIDVLGLSMGKVGPQNR